MPIAVPIAIAAASLVSGLFGANAAAEEAQKKRKMETMNQGLQMQSDANTRGAAAQQDSLGSIINSMRLR